MLGLPAIPLLAALYSPGLAQPWAPEEFPIGYWCGPPAQHNTPESWQRIKDCNFTWAMGGGYDLAGNKRMLDLCGQLGLKAMVIDGRLSWQMTMGDDWRATIAQVVADYGSHPALYGYYLQDEPNHELFQALGQISQELQKQDPAHLPYINLFPTYASVQQLGTPTYQDHLDKFLSIVKPAVLSYDHYCLRADGSDGPDYFENLGFIREYGLRYGTPPWNIIQAMSFAPGAVRQPNEAEMRWQVYTSLAYGMKGIMYFVYWSYSDDPAVVGIVDSQGQPAKLFPIVQKLNGEMKALGKTLLGLRSTAVYHTGPIPRGATRLPGDALVNVPEDLPLVIGVFAGDEGQPYVLIANASHKEPAEFMATLKPHIVAVSRVSAEDGAAAPLELQDHRLPISLEPGGGVLLRLTTRFDYPQPPRPLTEINFRFDRDGDLEGWGGANSLGGLTVEGGTLSMTITGPDPYLCRTFLQLTPNQYNVVKIRMKLPPGQREGQFLWTTSDSPSFADDKYMNFAVQGDGEWHEYTIPVGTHAMWRGKAVRAIRLDPTVGGGEGGTVQVDSIAGQ